MGGVGSTSETTWTAPIRHPEGTLATLDVGMIDPEASADSQGNELPCLSCREGSTIHRMFFLDVNSRTLDGLNLRDLATPPVAPPMDPACLPPRR